MLITGHQPNYLPYLGFFEKAARAELLVLVDTTQFVKRGPFGWIHRNRIRTAEGWIWLTVPVRTKGRFQQKICDVEIDNTTPWARKHLRSLQRAYSRAPFWDRYEEGITEIYERSWAKLAELNEALIGLLLMELGIDTPVTRASDLGVEGVSTGYVLDLCSKAEATGYISGLHGRDYLEETSFAEADVRLVFQTFEHPRYPQCWKGDFVENLSVVDLLFNQGPESLDLLLSGNDYTNANHEQPAAKGQP